MTKVGKFIITREIELEDGNERERERGWSCVIKKLNDDSRVTGKRMVGIRVNLVLRFRVIIRDSAP